MLLPSSIVVSAEARSQKLRSAALLGQVCVFPSLPAASCLSLQERPCSSDTLPPRCGLQKLHSKQLRSQQGKPGLTHGLAGSQSVHPLTSIASGRGLGSSQGGEPKAVGEHLPSCGLHPLRQSHHWCLPSPDGKQAIRKFLLRHRNQKPNTTQEGEKHHKPAISRTGGPKGDGPSPATQ